MTDSRIDVVIAARGGSEGLPGKNRRVLLDRPLVAHAIACAQMLTTVERIVVTTDDPNIAEIALEAGASVPELRPPHLATASASMLEVIHYVIDLISREFGSTSPLFAILDPTTPARDPEVIDRAARAVAKRADLDGAIGVSRPSFNPIWVGVERDDSDVIAPHPLLQQRFTRRQDVPDYWRINGSLYIWKTSFAASIDEDWLSKGRHLAVDTIDWQSISIDTLEDFELMERFAVTGLVQLPWVNARRTP